MRTVHIAIVALALLAATPASSQTLRPGRYEVTGEVDMGGRSMKIPPSQDCITAEMVNDLTKVGAGDQGLESCTVSNVKSTGNTVSFETACDLDGERIASTTELTFGADWYKTRIKREFDGRTTSISSTAKRVGDCR